MSELIRWLTIREAADRACCRPRRIQQAVRNGYLRAEKVGRHGQLRFLETWLDEWLIGRLLPEDGEINVAIDAAPTGRGLSL
jgi:excisionase family DNA binding protein